MKLILPPSVFLGNFEKLFDNNQFPTGNETIDITSYHSWVSLHPLVGAMLNPLTHESTVNLPKSIMVHNSLDVEQYFDNQLPQLNLQSNDLLLVKYIISEITRNTFEHAHAPTGASLSVVYSQKSNTLRIGIADRGIGLLTSLQSSHEVQNDYDAILTALTPGITGTTSREGGSPQNAGAGLFFVKSIAVWLQSHFLVYSGTGLYKLLKRKTQRIKLNAQAELDHASGGNSYPKWLGTAVGIDIPLGKIDNFDTILSKIREEYSQAVYDRIKGGQNSPQFT